jgi:predicted transcriptional regulator
LSKAQEGNIIRNVIIKVADEKDLEFVQGLESLGMNRNVAGLITYLNEVKEGSSRDIETATGLRQPEVSIAMRTLRQNNWVEEREVKVEGQGRPMKIYKLSVPIEKIIKHYEEEKHSESTQAMESIQKLREMTVI